VQEFQIEIFRQDFPEFSDLAIYPTSTILFWSGLATSLLSQQIWGTTWIYAVSLYVAHEMTLAGLNQQAGAAGGTPGVNGGIANNKTVGGASVGYDTQSTAEKNAGYWNLTNYGKQLYRLIQIFGAGCIQINGGRFPFPYGGY
jgi:hypothetical protein